MGAQPTADERPETKTKQKSVLFRNRDFALLWGSESISLLGSEISVIALPSLAVLIFGAGPLGVGVLAALQWLPFVLLAPLMGVFTDRWSRRTMMQTANIARVIILGSLPLAALFGALTMTQLYIAALLKGIFDVVFQLAYQAYMPQVLGRDDLVDGNAKTEFSRSISQVVGRSIGGGLVSLIGAARAIAVDAVTYLIGAIGLAFIKHKEPPPKPSEAGLSSVMAELKGGVTLTFGNRLLRNLTLMATFGNVAFSLTLTMIVVYAYDDLGFSGAQLGLALGIGAAAAIVGAIFAQKVNERLGMGPALVLTHLLEVIAFLLLPAATLGGTAFAFTVIVVSQCLASVTIPISNVAIMTMIQKITPPEAMGRVGGVAVPFVWGANAVGPLLGGVVAAAIGTQSVFYAAAFLALVSVAWIYVGTVQRVHTEVPEEERLKV